MTREEIKDELYRMLSDVVNGGYPIRNNVQRGIYREAVKEAIKALSCSENPNKWIPVSERLPETAGDYLTTTMYGEVYCDYWTGINFNRQEVIIAWQPLPEPYKAESEDKE